MAIRIAMLPEGTRVRVRRGTLPPDPVNAAAVRERPRNGGGSYDEQDGGGRSRAADGRPGARRSGAFARADLAHARPARGSDRREEARVAGQGGRLPTGEETGARAAAHGGGGGGGGGGGAP